MTTTVISPSNHGQHVRHREYVTAGNWKCAASPTKAHHWMVKDDGSQKCRHCKARKAKPKVNEKNRGVW